MKVWKTDPYKENSKIAIASFLCWLAAIGCLVISVLPPLSGVSVAACAFFVSIAFVLAVIAIAWIIIRHKVLKVLFMRS